MLSTFRCLTNISNQISIRSELACSFLKSCPLNTAKWSVQSFGQKNFLHLYSPRRKDADRIERRRDALTSSKRKQDFSGEKFFEIDESIKRLVFFKTTSDGEIT